MLSGDLMVLSPKEICFMKFRESYHKNWLVVLAILKNISQWEGLSHILWKIKNA
jgi:hypothetical protein